MNRGIRITTAAVVALTVALGASGCTEATSIYSDVVITSELDGLARELGELGGVTVTHTSSIQADYTYQVAIDVQVDDPEAETLRTVIERSVETLAGDVLAKQRVYFHVGSGEQSLFSTDSLAEGQTLDDVIEQDLDYWLALRDASGAPLSLAYYGNDDPENSRTRAISSSEPVDVAALRSVDDPLDIPTQWAFPGLGSVGLPSVAEVELFEKATEILPAASDIDYLDPGVSFALQHGDVYVYVRSVALAEGAVATDSATLPATIDIARLIAERASSISFFDTSYTFESSVYFGVCEKPSEPRDSDRQLFDALRAAGVGLPAGSGPGYCNDGF